MTIEVAPYKVVSKLGMLMIEKIVHISGTFLENFELEDFPFDVQDLQLHIIFRESEEICKIFPNPGKDEFVKVESIFGSLTEWTIHPPIVQIRTEPEE